MDANIAPSCYFVTSQRMCHTSLHESHQMFIYLFAAQDVSGAFLHCFQRYCCSVDETRQTLSGSRFFASCKVGVSMNQVQIVHDTMRYTVLLYMVLRTF